MDGRLVAVLASGEGTTTEALIRAGAEGEISCEVGLVIASKQSAGVLNRSRGSIRSTGAASLRHALIAAVIRLSRESACGAGTRQPGSPEPSNSC